MTENTEFDRRRSEAIRTLIVTNARVDGERRAIRRRIALVVGLVVAALLLSGGGVALAFGPGILVPAPAPASTSTPAPTESPTPEPKPPIAVPAPVGDPADPATWVIGFDGIGPVKLGRPLAELDQETPTLNDETDDMCRPSQVDLVGEHDLRLHAFATPEAEDTIASLYLNARLPQDTEALPRTESGIGIGSTEAELLAAYPGIPVTGTFSTSTYYGIQDDSGTWIVFGVGNERVEAIGVGPRNTLPKEFCPA